MNPTESTPHSAYWRKEPCVSQFQRGFSLLKRVVLLDAIQVQHVGDRTMGYLQYDVYLSRRPVKHPGILEPCPTGPAQGQVHSVPGCFL